MPATRRNNVSRGFTLLELVLALTIAAVVGAVLSVSLRTGLRSPALVEAAIEPSRTAAFTMELIRLDLQNAMAPTGILAGDCEGTQAQDNRGHEADDLIFFATSDGPQHVDANGEIKQIELTVVTPPGTDDHVLIRRVTRNLLAQVQAQPDEEVVCRGVAGFALEYFDGSNWQATWDSTQEDNTLPAAVQVTLQLERPASGGQTRTLNFVRVFPLACSTAAQDPTVNTGTSMLP